MQKHGTIIKKFATNNVTNTFSKREFWLETDQNTPYPQTITMEFQQSKCPLLDSFDEGDEVSVDFNILGRVSTNAQGEKCFNTLQAWKIELVNKGKGPSKSNGKSETVTKKQKPDNEDLPF